MREALPPERIAELGNSPQSVMDANALGSLQEALGGLGDQKLRLNAALARDLLSNLRAALADAIGEAFLVGFFVLVLAAAAAALMKEYPLSKGWGRDEPTACSDAPEGHADWTIQLLADKVVAMGFAESISLGRT